MNSGQAARTGSAIVVAALLFALPALAGTRIEKQLELAPGGEFVLDTDMGSVVVRGGSSNGAHVVITSKRDDLDSQVTLGFDESPGRVEVRLDKKSKISSWFKKSPGLQFEIEVPRQTALNIDTSGGAIRMEEIGGDITAETSGGSIRIKEAGGRVVAETSGGPVEVLFASGNSHGGTLSTSGGGVTVHVDPAVGLEVDASTSGGSVILDVPLTVQGKISRTAIRGTLGDGGAMLKLRSSGGSIRVSSR